MLKPLLIEIGVEELPAIPFLKELPNIEKKWLDILEKNSLTCDFQFFYTPRRLTLWHREFKVKQDDEVAEIWGAPKAIAEKNPKALESFANKNSVKVEEVEFKERNNQEFLYIKKEIIGKSSVELIGEMVEEFIKSLNFGKTMRWNGDFEFIRPIRWLLAMLDDKQIDFEVFGVKSSNKTYGHRNFKDEIYIDFCGTYFCQLDKKGVILYQDERKKRVLDGIKSLENKHGFNVEIDTDLLDEVVAITEYPNAVLGSFDEDFLVMPPEVIITSMKEHQRYFPVFKDGKLTNHFIVASNAHTNDFTKVASGNERVLKARLSDALFFWNNDLKNGLNSDGLKNIIYMKGLGSIYDKQVREAKIATTLANKFGVEAEKLEKAVMLSKADLLTEMVYEFTELQGLMGYYYATKFGEDIDTAIAIKEQYSNESSNLFSALLSISTKLDSIMALYSINSIPKGSKDPFALRRAAISIIKLILDHNININLEELVNEIKSNYKEFNTNLVIEFIFERLFNYFNSNPSLIKAVIASGESDILEISKKLNALEEIVESEGFKDSFNTFKRVANISKDVNIDDELNINETLFENEYEKSLFTEFNKTKEEIKDSSYLEKMDKLFSLKSTIDNFFDNTMVNAEDENLKNNRKNLVASVYKEFLDIADIKEISI
jgi:glycyl-tRNA synthetase beta chain